MVLGADHLQPSCLKGPITLMWAGHPTAAGYRMRSATVRRDDIFGEQGTAGETNALGVSSF